MVTTLTLVKPAERRERAVEKSQALALHGRQAKGDDGACDDDHDDEAAAAEGLPLDDDGKVHLWKLLHTWLQHDQVQSKWASVLNGILMRIYSHWHDNPACLAKTRLRKQQQQQDENSSNDGLVGNLEPLSIQLFETGSAASSKYLSTLNYGDKLHSLSDLPIENLLGGTVRLYGVHSSLHQKMVDIMAHAVYTLYALTMETQLFQDHHHTLGTHLASYHRHPNAWKPLAPLPWRHQVMGWFTGKRDTGVAGNDDPRQASLLPSPPTSPTTATSTTTITTAGAAANTPVLLKHLKKPFKSPALFQSSSPSNKATSAAVAAASRPLPPVQSTRFHQLRVRLEQACISTSPHCVFVAPPIIALLEKQEESRREQQHSSQSPGTTLKDKLTHLARRSSTLLFSVDGANRSFVSVRRPSAYDLLRGPNQSILESSSSKFGLDHLYLDTFTTDAFRHHQHITIHVATHLIGCAEKPCLGPFLCTLQYFNFDQDQVYADLPLGTILLRWYHLRNQPCKVHMDQVGAACLMMVAPPAPTPSQPSLPSSPQQQQQQKQQQQIRHATSHSSNNSSGSSSSSSNASDASSQHSTNGNTNVNQNANMGNGMQPATCTASASSSPAATILMPSPPSLSPASTHPSVVQDGCRQPLADHVLCFSHGTRRIQVYFVTMPASAMVRPEIPTLTPLTTPPATPKAATGGKQAKQEKQAKQTRLCFWMACTSCDARTPPTWVSSATRRFSFGKYIELFLYSQRFTSVSAFCPHTRTPDNARHHIACCFGILPDDDAPDSTDALEIRFVSEAINVYALKGPPLQAVLPSTASGASNSSHNDASFNHASLSLRVHESVLQRWYRAEEHALDGFFRQLRDHVLKLQERYHVARHDTTRWLATFDQQHTHLTRTLTQHQQQHTALNEFRRLFTTVATELVHDYRQWHHAQPWAAQTRQKVKDAAIDNNEKTESDTDTFQWRDAPDYATPLADANTKGIHCFPNSSIVVREAEPTSIIAYTLSCMDYVAELASESARSEVSTSVPATPPLPPLKDSQDERISAIHRDKDVPPRPPAKSYGTSSTTTRSSSGQATDEQPQVLDEYFSTIERKFIAPSLGSATETASFRTMVMETVRNNVSDVQQSRRLTRMKRKWHRMARLAEDGPQNGHESMASTSFSQPASAASLAVPGAPQQYVLSDTTSEFQGTFVQPMAADVTQPVSPHILHRFAHGNVEFTCTVYYAHEFEHVRRLCGVQQLMIESLARCQSWTATGGKSKSQFYKTQDDRMVVKEMVNAWNIAEKDAFLRFAPKYFQHIKETAQSPSILAKIFGFYSLQMRTVDDKRVLLDMDLLVMEQLFYGHKITRTFDFKGIPDRQLDEEKRQRANVTLWDGDWRQGYRISYAVNGQSKAWMASAITRDTEFLAHGNIMDYSLLVGVDASTNELVIGIVDFIGAYTWYKKIESKSKSTIQRHREVTVLPPDQYRARFCKQILNYFIPIPGKFDKIPMEHTQTSRWLK